MSMITSTLPLLLNTFTAPAADSPTVTWFGVGELVAVQFRLDARGLGSSAGNRVRKLDAVGLAIVVLVAIPVAVVGMVQLPFVPHTANVAVSPGPREVPLEPT